MGRTTVLEGLTSRIEMGAGWEIHASIHEFGGCHVKRPKHGKESCFW